ncbi:MAG: hypothetical protein J1F63_08060 [Oscillospiraceae bacterium]|nr:hypothetical protein [Oscillospiraceae bacterium]
MKIRVTAVIAAAAAAALAVTAFAADSVPMIRLTPAQTTDGVKSVPMTALTPALAADEAAAIGVIGGADGPTAVYVAASAEETTPAQSGYTKIERLQALKAAVANAKTEEEALAAMGELQELLASWDSAPAADKAEETMAAGLAEVPNDDEAPVIETTLEFEPAEEIL